MCKEVQVAAGIDAVLCDTVGELRTALASVVFIENDAFVPRDEDCLCSVDFARTAAAAGMTARVAGVGEGFPFPELILTRNGVAPSPPPLRRVEA